MTRKKPEKINISLPFEEREGQIGVNSQSLKMKITRYSKLEGQKYSTIDVEFLIDGYKIYNRQYNDFLLGYIKNSNFPDSKFIDRTGERIQNNQGDWMEIIKCYGENNNTVRFDDDGSIVKGVYYGNFKKGKVEHPVRFTESLYYNYPEVARAIANEKNGITLEDTEHMKCATDDLLYIKCPDCGKYSSKKKYLYNLTSDGISCEYCSDGITIPNKMLRQISEQLNLNWVFEYSPNWLKINNKKPYSFDAYDDNLKIAIEMDPEYKDNHKGKRKLIDELKDKLAKEHNIEVIRIDLMDNNEYNTNTLEYIRIQLYKKIKKLYDLDKIDWYLAWINCQKSLMIEACRLWQEEYIYSTSEIGKILNLCDNTIRGYLNRGYKLGLCDYTPEKAKKEQGKKISGVKHYYSNLYWVIKSNGEKYSDKPLCGSEIYNSNSIGFLNINKTSFDKYIKLYNNIDLSRIPIKGYTNKLIEKLTPFDGWQFIPLSKEEKQQYLESINNQQPQ